MIWPLTWLCALTACHPQAPIETLSVRSPDGRVEILAGEQDGALTIRIRHDGADVIAPSPVGVQLDGSPTGPLRIVDTKRIAAVTAADRKTPPYREIQVDARRTGGQGKALTLRLRAYDTGAAFRWILPAAGENPVKIVSEKTELRFPRDYSCLAVRHSAYMNSHEGDYAPLHASQLRPGALYDLPLSCRTGRGGETIALAESDVEDFPGAYLVKGKALGVGWRLTPMPANDRFAAIRHHEVAAPWRIVMIAARPERLIENTLVAALAPPSRIGDSNWVQPGKASWAWWAGREASGVPNPGFNNPTYRAYVDFAARFGLRYFVIDWGWAARPNGAKEIADVTQSRADVDIPALARYAETRGVRLWLWTNWAALNGRMDAVFALFERWGVAGIKVDYVYRQDQRAMNYYHRLLQTAARHHLLVNIHGSPVPRGLERTYPNLLTQEGVMGAEYNKWSRKVTAGYNVRVAYSRAVIGPMDYTPGGFRNVTPAAFTVRQKLPEVMTTRAQQLAMFVVYPSPLQSLCDAPSAYMGNDGRLAPGAGFLRTVPASWDETRGIAGDWGKWIAVARRSGARWFIGVLGDDHPRTIVLPLDALGKGGWRFRALTDGSSPVDVQGRAGTVRAGGKLRLSLAANGGAVFVLDR